MNQHKRFETLADLPDGATATIGKMALGGTIRTRLHDLGMIEGTTVTCLGHGSSGDPTAYCIRGAVIALRRADSCRIEVQS